MNKRDLLLSVLERASRRRRAGGVLHALPEYHGGQAAVEKHLDFFHFTGMDFIKTQHERSSPVPQIRRPEDWAMMPFTTGTL